MTLTSFERELCLDIPVRPGFYLSRGECYPGSESRELIELRKEGDSTVIAVIAETLDSGLYWINHRNVSIAGSHPLDEAIDLAIANA